MVSALEEKSKFEKVLPELIDEISSELSGTNIPGEALKWIREAMIYNSAGGKLNRGLSVIDTYKLLTDQEELSVAEFKRAAVLGWTIELLQAFFLVADDIMDASLTRRGQPCWYKKPEVGMLAINDAFIMESAIYVLLKKYFREFSCYVNLVELYHEITLFTELGQLLDLITAPEDLVDLSRFSLQKYHYIVTYKTAYYSFYLPVALALYLADLASPNNLEQSKSVLLPLGTYFQVQDDYLDCYGDPHVTGKIGTDIQDNKCSWIINKALLNATNDQRIILEANYGKKDPESIHKVREIFDDLGLKQCFAEYEESIVSKIHELIDSIDESEGLKKEVFTLFLDKIYKREK